MIKNNKNIVLHAMKNNILFYNLLLIGLIESALVSSNTNNHIHLVSDDAFRYLTSLKNDDLKELISTNTPIEVIKSSSGDSLLHDMALHGNVDLVEHLTKHGSNVNRQNQYGRTPLHQGIFSNSLATVECLIKHGADINIQENQYKDSPLSLADRKESCVSDEIRVYVDNRDSCTVAEQRLVSAELGAPDSDNGADDISIAGGAVRPFEIAKREMDFELAFEKLTPKFGSMNPLI